MLGQPKLKGYGSVTIFLDEMCCLFCIFSNKLFMRMGVCKVCTLLEEATAVASSLCLR